MAQVVTSANESRASNMVLTAVVERKSFSFEVQIKELLSSINECWGGLKGREKKVE
jgi:hypothetical protein